VYDVVGVTVFDLDCVGELLGVKDGDGDIVTEGETDGVCELVVDVENVGVGVSVGVGLEGCDGVNETVGEHDLLSVFVGDTVCVIVEDMETVFVTVRVDEMVGVSVCVGDGEADIV
jgi:hypothetical protein